MAEHLREPANTHNTQDILAKTNPTENFAAWQQQPAK
jgi:hypothetical protein